MANKAHKVASRQAQMNQRNKKRRGGKAKPQGQAAQGASEQRSSVAVEHRITGESEPEAQGQESQPAQAPQRQQSAPGARAAPQQQTVSRPTPARRARQRTSNEPHVYRFLGSELRHIGMVAAVMGAGLATLTFILG